MKQLEPPNVGVECDCRCFVRASLPWESTRRAVTEYSSKALAELEIKSFDDIDILDPATPEQLRGWGSATILVDSEDVSGAPKGNSVGGRVYLEPDRECPAPRPSLPRFAVRK
jgi:hypothetical protein